LVCSGIVAFGFFISGRTLINGLRRAPTTHPNLHDRLANMVGQHGEAATAFEDSRGKVKVGDTVWLAEGDVAIREGDRIIVTGSERGLLKVKTI
jgi:membrane protein implicated in regulation of membrane protease activity